MATGASWKGQSNLWFPNCKGIIREPEHVREEPSAVNVLLLNFFLRILDQEKPIQMLQNR